MNERPEWACCGGEPGINDDGWENIDAWSEAQLYKADPVEEPCLSWIAQGRTALDDGYPRAVMQLLYILDKVPMGMRVIHQYIEPHNDRLGRVYDIVVKAETKIT